MSDPFDMDIGKVGGSSPFPILNVGGSYFDADFEGAIETESGDPILAEDGDYLQIEG